MSFGIAIAAHFLLNLILRPMGASFIARYQPNAEITWSGLWLWFFGFAQLLWTIPIAWVLWPMDMGAMGGVVAGGVLWLIPALLTCVRPNGNHYLLFDGKRLLTVASLPFVEAFRRFKKRNNRLKTFSVFVPEENGPRLFAYLRDVDSAIEPPSHVTLPTRRLTRSVAPKSATYSVSPVEGGFRVSVHVREQAYFRESDARYNFTHSVGGVD